MRPVLSRDVTSRVCSWPRIADSIPLPFRVSQPALYEFPNDLACEIAIETVSKWLSSHPFPKDIIFCCFDALDANLYRQRLAAGTS